MSCPYCEKKTVRSEEMKDTLNKRVNRIIGQMNGVKKMIDNDTYCVDLLTQLSAIEKSIRSLSNVVLDNHMHNCVRDAIKDGNDESIDEIMDIIKRFN